MIPPHTIIEIACTPGKITPHEFLYGNKSNEVLEARYTAYLLLKRHSRFTNRKLAYIADRSESSISKAIRYIEAAIKEPGLDQRKLRLIEAIEAAEKVIEVNKFIIESINSGKFE